MCSAGSAHAARLSLSRHTLTVEMPWGFLDTLLGRTKGVAPKVESLFSMATAYITLSTEFSLQPTGKAWHLFQAR